MSSEPKYIVVDGMDGAGKSTVIQAIREIYSSFYRTREPGGTDFGEQVRSLLLDPRSFLLPRTELCMVLAARSESRKVVQEALASGKHVISDRSESSTFAYQLYGSQSLDLESFFWKANEFLAPFPTLYIILDLDAEVAAKRMGGRATVDRFEKEKREFHKRVRIGYHEFSKKVSAPCVFIDAEQNEEKVLDDVKTAIDKHIGIVPVKS
jgi:dTMP kinase